MKLHDETVTRRSQYVPVPDGQASFDFSALPDMPATEKQRRYIAVLMDQLGWYSEQLAAYAAEQRVDLVAMTKNQATAFIDGLKRLAEPRTPAGPAPRVEGDDLFPEDTVTCRACGVSFVDLNGKRLCDACLVDRVNGVGELELDDPDDVINQPVLRIPELRPITCRVCGLTAKVVLGAPNLCHACTADLLMTRQHVEATLEASEAALDRAAQTWLDAQNAADDATLARWHKAEQYIKAGQTENAAFRATWERERAAATPLGTLLRAYEAYTTAEQAAREIRTWAERAITEIEATHPAPRPNEYEVPESAKLVECRSCGAAMVWIKTPAGKPLPLSVATTLTRDGVRYALPHFADCPEAKDWSRK